MTIPKIVAVPDGFKTDRPIGEPTVRIGIDDVLPQRYVLDDVDWGMPTDRVVEIKDGVSSNFASADFRKIKTYNF